MKEIHHPFGRKIRFVSRDHAGSTLPAHDAQERSRKSTHGGPIPPPHPWTAAQRHTTTSAALLHHRPLFMRVSMTILCIILVGTVSSFFCGDLTSKNQASALTTMAAAATDEDASSDIPESASVDLAWISQLPELPTGCEITSATMLANYYGLAATKTELNEYLPQSGDIDISTILGKRYGPDPDEEFIGETTSEDGCYCDPGPIVEALNGYFAEKSSSYTAQDITGTSPSKLYELVANGTPVEVWVTIDLEKRQVDSTWYSEVDGSKVQIDSNDHAMVLIGYTPDSVILADPLEGIVTYPKSVFESSYRSRGEMALIIGE